MNTDILAIRNLKCKLCDLHKNASHVCLMGTGKVPSDLMLLGESPGEEEDHKGLPFVGSSGKMLDSILANIDEPIDRKDIYITNVVKCHPVGNHKPAPSKIYTCSEKYLRQELKVVRPRLILCLGKLASSTLLQEFNTAPLGQLRNQVFYTKKPLLAGIPFIISYHPAATFHNPDLLQYIVEDIQWAQKLLRGDLPRPKKSNKYKELTSIWQIPDLQEARFLSLDLETDGLDPFLPNKDILSIQLTVKRTEGYYFEWNKKIRKELYNYFSPTSSNKLIVLAGHNIKFDLKWLREKAGIVYTGEIEDTIQDIHLLDENFPSKDLDTVATTFTELKGHKGKLQKLVDGYVKQHKEKKEPITKARSRLWAQAFFTVPKRIRINYGCGDVDAVARLSSVFRPKIRQKDLVPLWNLMNNSVKVYTDAECHGFKVDTDLMEGLNVEYQKKIAKQKKILDRLCPFKDTNYNSPLQLKQILYGNFKCYPHEIRMGKKRVQYSTGEEALKKILEDKIKDDTRLFVSTLLEYRETSKLKSVYIEGMSEFLRPGNFIHPTWNLTGTDTGRSSCSKPNLQQIPRTSDIKKLFISRYKDGVLMQIDVSQGELRIAAHVSGEPTMLRLFNGGTKDFHRSSASAIYKLQENKISDAQRYNAKQVNFAVLYEAGAKTTAQEMKGSGATYLQALEFIKKWHETFSGWKPYTDEVKKFVIENGYIRNLFGRYRHLTVYDPKDYETGIKVLKKAVNAPIQGGLADYSKLCGYNLWMRLRKRFPKVFIIGEIHDEWKLDLPSRDLVEPVAIMAKDIFENPDTSEFGFKFKVPMKIDIKVGPNWKEMEEVNIGG